MSTSLASSDLSAGTSTPENLFAGSSDIITKADTIKQAGAIAKLTTMGRITASGKLIKSVQTAVDGSQTVVAIMVEAIDTTSADKTAPVYIAGEFDIDALVWDATYDTNAKKLAAAADGALVFKTLLSV